MVVMPNRALRCYLGATANDQPEQIVNRSTSRGKMIVNDTGTNSHAHRTTCGRASRPVRAGAVPCDALARSHSSTVLVPDKDTHNISIAAFDRRVIGIRIRKGVNRTFQMKCASSVNRATVEERLPTAHDRYRSISHRFFSLRPRRSS
jgi:hypothetical protein